MMAVGVPAAGDEMSVVILTETIICMLKFLTFNVDRFWGNEDGELDGEEVASQAGGIRKQFVEALVGKFTCSAEYWRRVGRFASLYGAELMWTASWSML